MALLISKIVLNFSCFSVNIMHVHVHKVRLYFYQRFSEINTEGGECKSFFYVRPCIFRYRGGIYDQEDATDSQSLLLEMLYMFRAIIAHHHELGTVCAAVRWHIQFRAPDDGQ
jgi:hypothetical protein